MPESTNAPSKSKRDLLLQGMTERHPDRSYADDEELFGQINDDYADYDNQLQGYRDREKAMSDLFTSDERSAGILQKMRTGEDPVLYLVREFGPDIKERLDDPEFQSEVEAAGKEYKESIAANKKYEEEYSSNVQSTLEAIDAYQAENGLSDEEIDAILNNLSNIARDFVAGIINANTLKMVSDAINHDNDVATANHEGEVRGRNAKIDEKLRKASRGDGTTPMDGQNGAPRAAQRSNMGALDRFDGGSTIWERGGEKRKRY